MTGRNARLAYGVSAGAIAAFVVLLVFALVRLWGPAAETRRNVGNNMLWALTQAHAAALLLDGAVARQAGDVPGEVALERRYDVLLSRLNLLSEGPQARYMEELGFADTLAKHTREVLSLDPEISSLAPGELRLAGRLHAALVPLEQLLGRAANRSMVTQWNATGARLDAEHSAIVQVIASILAIAVLGAGLALAMVRVVVGNHRTQQALHRETQMREAYRSFVDLVSHQFRTPLSVMDASIQRILRRGDRMPREEVTRRMHKMRASIADLTVLIDATLGGMEADAGGIELAERACDPVGLIESVRRRQLEATPGRRVDLDVGRGIPCLVVTDPVRVEQVLANLLSNAIKYSPDREPVVVAVRADGETLSYAVRDNGIGIPEDEQGHVFSRFFRARTAADYPGTGVGLSVSRTIAEMLGGSLGLRSGQGLGSTFTLRLPLVLPDADGTKAGNLAEPVPPPANPVRTDGARPVHLS